MAKPYLKKKNEITASSASMNEALKSAGTKKSRSFAIPVSSSARLNARTSSLMVSAMKPTASAAGCNVGGCTGDCKSGKGFAEVEFSIWFANALGSATAFSAAIHSQWRDGTDHHGPFTMA